MTGNAIITPAVPAEGPKLEAFRCHEGELTTWEYESTDENGRPVTRLNPLPVIDRYTRLIPETECRAIIAELEAALTPAHYDQARTLARTVIGRYPKRELIDPDIFVVEMTRVFAEAPADLGQQAADALRFHRFLPNVGDVKAVLDPLVDERRAALNQARRHLAEHQRRKAETAKPKPETYQDLTPAERKAFDGEIQRVKRGGQPRPIAEVLGRCRK